MSHNRHGPPTFKPPSYTPLYVGRTGRCYSPETGIRRAMVITVYDGPAMDGLVSISCMGAVLMFEFRGGAWRHDTMTFTPDKVL